MAEKIERPAPSASPATRAAAAERSAAEALEILHPERQLEVAGRVLEFREYGYVEGLKLQAAGKAFLDDLYVMFDRGHEPPSAEAIADVLADHILEVQWMIAQCITPLDDSPDVFVSAVADNARWIGTLGEDDGDLLASMWWEVNRRFFTRRLQRRALAARAARASASSGSTTP